MILGGSLYSVVVYPICETFLDYVFTRMISLLNHCGALEVKIVRSVDGKLGILPQSVIP